MSVEVLPALWLSLRIAFLATLIALALAMPLAACSARLRFRGRGLLDALLILPLALPPTVVGYAMLVLLGRRGWIGHWLDVWLGYTLIFRFEAAVLAAAVVAFPLIYLPTKSAMASVSREMLDAARVYGATRWQLFWRVLVPLSRRGILAGTVLGFARALGEFGATMMIYGWSPSRITLPILIYQATFERNENEATVAVALLIAASLIVVVVYNKLLTRDE